MTVRVLLLLLPVLFAACAREKPAAVPFREASEATGLLFRHVSGASGRFLMPEIMGSGAALLDYDDDGDLDVYLVQGPSATGSRLFRNELKPSGKLRFSDVTEAAGAGFRGHGMGAATGDYDNDGDIDLYVTAFGANALFRNNGNGTFSNITTQAGLEDNRWSTSAAFFDYDRDGLLDLFVGNYLNYTVAANKPCSAPTGEPDFCNPAIYEGLPGRLLRNRGDGTFEDATAASGIGSRIGKALGVVTFDFDRDGWTDVYVANDGIANFLWRNRGGRFQEVGLPSGVACDADGRAQAGMGVDAADLNGDGAEDLFVTNLTSEPNNLFRSDGTGSYSDSIASSGMGPASRLFTGFGTRFFDYDHDGQLDLFVANGAVTRVESQRGSPHPFRQPNQLFRNTGNSRFEEILRFEPAEVARGAAFGDIDLDGDIDIVVTNNNGPVRLLLNQAADGKPSLMVKLEGNRANRQGLGARVALLRDGKPLAWRRVQTDGSYLSASEAAAHFASRSGSGLLVEWPDGKKEAWPDAPHSGRITLRQHTGR